MLLNRTIAWICFILSQGTIAISYLVSLQYDHPKVLSCNPFIQGCLNITDAGIYSPEGFIFRGGMITACAFFIMWWLISLEFIQQKQQGFSKLNVASTALGILGAVLLIIATAVLVPPREDINWTVHVAGATLFFLVTFGAQALHYYMIKGLDFFSDKSKRYKFINVLTQAFMIAMYFLMDNTDSGEIGDIIKNAVEWWLALLIAVYFLTAILDWKHEKQPSH